MKNIIYLVVVVGFLFGGYFIFFNEKEEKELNILLLSGDHNSLKALINGYASKNNLKINVEETGFFDFISEIEENHRQGQAVPDVFLVINDWIGDLAEKGILEVLEEENLENCIELSKEAVKYNGSYYALPFKMETLYLFYNKKFVGEIDANVENVLKEAQKIKNEFGIEGLSFPMDEYYYHYPWYIYYGGDRESLFSGENSENLEKSLNEIVGRFKYSNVFTVNSKFIEEKTAMTITGNWEIENFMNMDKGIDYKIISDDGFRPFLGVKSYAVYKGSENKEEAKALLKYLSSYEAQSELNKDMGAIPVNKKVLEESNKKAVVEFRNKNGEFDIMPNGLEMKPFWKKMSRVLNRIFVDKISVKEALKEGNSNEG